MASDRPPHPNSTSTRAGTTGTSDSGTVNRVLLASGLLLGIAGIFITTGLNVEKLPVVPTDHLSRDLMAVVSLIAQATATNVAVVGPLVAGIGLLLCGIAVGMWVRRT